MNIPSRFYQKLSAIEELALTHGRRGLKREAQGWSAEGGDRDAIFRGKTIKALARKGLVEISADGERAFPIHT
jgi:hypothetical protein